MIPQKQLIISGKKISIVPFGLLTLLTLLSCLTCHSQQQETKTFNIYTLHHKKFNQNKVVLPIGTKNKILKAGWTITETIAGINIERTLAKDSIVSVPCDSVITVTKNWKIESIKHTTQEPNKVYLNPVTFKDSLGANLNQLVYIQLPVNEKVILTHLHTKWSAITIPFTIRPEIKNRLNSQVTSEFKIGTAFSLNHDWDVYKNRRIDVKKNTYGFSTGLGFGLGLVTLNNGSTQFSGANYDNEEEGLVFFITPGIGLNIRGFKILGFYGWDIGLTKNTKDWNYNKRPYIGIGLGFDFWTMKK